MTHTTPVKISARRLLITCLLPIWITDALAYQDIDPDYQSHCDPPHPYGHKVDESGAAFYYLSDIEDCSDDGRLPLLVSRVRNVHSDDLIVTWKSDEIVLISRPASNQLPAGETEDGSHPICGYDEHPDTNTTISYTQQPIEKTVAAYLEKVSCQRDYALLQSHIRTAYRDNDGVIQKVEIAFTSSVAGGSLVYEIDQSHSAVDVALGQLSDAIESLQDEQQAKNMQQSIANDARKFGASTTFTTLNDWKSFHLAHDEIPQLLAGHEMVIFDIPTNADKHYMEWQIPIQPFATVVQGVAPLVLLDAGGEVITTRPIGLYIPRGQELE